MNEKENKKLIKNYNEILGNLNSLNSTLCIINPRLWHIKPHKTEKIFKVNDFIELRLEDGATTIYIAEKPLAYCSSVLINIDIEKEKLKGWGNIECIDDAIFISQGRRGRKRRNIIPEQEFQIHCSNIQAWVDHNYDTRMLHSETSFPLLKKLIEVGDQKAKSVFQQEIMKRFYQGHQIVIAYLIREKYLDYLEIDQIIDVMKVVLEKTGRFNADIDLKRMELKKKDLDLTGLPVYRI